MTFGLLIENLQQEIKWKYRKLENIKKKIIRGQWSIKFNNVCLSEGLMPTYTKN